MIRYSLKCADGHGFDSWFRDAAGFAALLSAGQVACPVCGTQKVEKTLMAPAVTTSRKSGSGAAIAPVSSPAADAQRPVLSKPASELEAAVARIRKELAENSEYVGMKFATEARRIHDGSAPDRAIHGEARPEDARQMIEDGLPVAPLPFLPPRKVN
jgi:hypothetical protein